VLRVRGSKALIAGIGETPYARRPEGETTMGLLARAARRALRDAGFEPHEVDGLAVASFTLAPDRAADVAWRLGLRLRWLSDEQTGGASALNMLHHALSAVEGGDAEVVLLLAGDLITDFSPIANELNSATRDHLAPIPHGGPNTLFALLTRRHMAATGLTREDYGRLVVAQHAAAGRTLSLAEYLSAPLVADPLTRYDCVAIVSGAGAVVVAATARVRRKPAAAVRAIGVRVNDDQQEGSGLRTGHAGLGIAATRVDVACVYDDYPALVLAQLEELGFGDARTLVDEIAAGRLRVNPSGGQLALGQAGVAGGMHGLVEAVRELRAGAGAALVTGYGMVLYRYGSIAAAATLARVD
jgi:acetyl-CoA acetyltransferase